MLGPLTYHAIAAMTRERLRQIEAALLAKIRSGTNVNPLDRQVRFLARRAHEIMSHGDPLPNDATLPPFTRKLSKQTVFGSIGLSFPKHAALFAPGQNWLFDTIRRGNADPNREMVLAFSTDLMFAIWERSRTLINDSNIQNKEAELQKLRSYILGHACHIAADLVSSPFVLGITARPGDAAQAQLSQAQVINAIEKAVSNNLYGHANARGDAFKDWWPESEALPGKEKFFQAYKEALEAKFGSGARPRLRPTDIAAARSLNPPVSPSFWKEFGADAPPDLSVRLLEDGFSSFRASLEHSRVWGWADWLGATALMFLPAIFAYPLILSMPHTRALFKDNALVEGQPVDKERGWFGLLMAPLATSMLSSPLISIYISAFTYFGVGRETVFGWIAGGVNLITSIIFLITRNNNIHPAIRWLLLFIIPYLGLLIHAIYVLGRGGRNRHHVQLALASLIPVDLTLLYLVFHLGWHTNQDLGMNGWLKDEEAGKNGWANGGFIGGWVLWTVIILLHWMLIPLALQGDEEAQPGAEEFVTGRGHFLRMFDHSALFSDPNLAQNAVAELRNPTLATHFFPSDHRPLLKVWWEGSGDLFIRSDRNALRFSTNAAGTNADQFVLAPAAPMTLAEFARFLNSAVKEGANFSKKLKVELVDTEDLDYIVHPGELFADVAFTKLKTKKDDADVLFHAPRSRLANFVGKTNTVVVDEDRIADVNGDGQIKVVAGSVNVLGSAIAGVNTRFTSFFRRGDVIATTSAPIQTRIVDTIVDDQKLTVTIAFTTPAGPVGYARKKNDRDSDFSPLGGTISPGAAYRTYVVGAGPAFETVFMVGDIIRAKPTAAGVSPEERVVIQVTTGPSQIMTDKPFSAAIVAGTPYQRVGRTTFDGFRYLPTSIPAGLFSGETLIDRAADLGAVLAMGTVSHLLTAADLGAVTSPPATAEDQRPAVNRVYQVFRNWNLNHRRMNEWRMLVLGNAVSEKRGAPRDPDSLQPNVPGGWTALANTSEETANRLGWVPLFQKWLDVARRPSMDSFANEVFREGDPTNRKLSEGIAFLLDLPMPPI